MRFPLEMTTRIASYVARKRVARTEKFPMVLMLEPLHACNLTCTGCGRIREYESTIKQKLSIQECLDAVDECGAPVVSICGGEPMIYPGIGELTASAMVAGVGDFKQFKAAHQFGAWLGVVAARDDTCRTMAEESF